MLTRSWGAKAARWAGTAVVAAALLLVGVHPALANYHEMDPNEARFIDHFVASGPLADPEDGRLRGYGFSATVAQVGEASSVEFRSFNNTAPAGHKIVVFAVRYAIHGPRRDYDRPVKGTVVIDGSRSPLDSDFGLTGDRTVAAAVPVGAKEVLFEMASAGVAQTFSLTEGKRVGPQPAILYRDAAWPDVVSDLTADRVVKAKDDDASASVTLAVKRVRLSWFSPGPTASGSADDPIMTPSSPDRAFLIVEGEGYGEEPDEGPYFKGFESISPADVRLKLADGSIVVARHAGETDGLLAGAYYFEVPATLGSATLVIGPASVKAERREEVADVPTTARLEAASFKLTVPGGDAAQESEGNPDVSATADGESTGESRTAPASRRSGGGLPVGLALLMLAVLAAAGGAVAVARRRVRGTGNDDGANDEPAPAPSPAVVSGPVKTVTLDSLAQGPIVALGGPGALDAARAALLAVDGERPASAVVLAHAETAALIPAGAGTPEWLTVVRDPDAVPSAVEVARVRAARLDAELAAEADRPPGARVVVVVPASFNGEAGQSVWAAAARQNGGPSVRLLVVGGDGLAVEADGTVGYNGSAARLSTMHEDEAVALLGRALGTSEPAEGEPATAAAGPRRVDIRLLGPLRITVDGREVAVGGRTKSRELLDFLALHRNGATADAAMEALRPGAPPDGPYFRKILSDLRAIVREATGLEGDPIERVGQRYRLDPSLFDVDLWRFEDAVAAASRGDDAAAEAAADAYGGDLLEGEDLLWADLARGDIQMRAIGNLTHLAERRRAAGDLAGALHAAQMAVGRDPDVEEHYQRVMELCRDLGRPDGARRAFKALEARVRELGRTPSDKSRELGLGG